MSKTQIRLSEDKLREFVSYSVARILKEAYGKPIYGKDEKFYGYEDSKYGWDTMKFEFDPFEDDHMMHAFEEVLGSGKYPGLTKEMFDDYEDGEYGRIWPVNVEVAYDYTEGMKGDQYLQPDDPDEIKVTGWDILDDMSKFGEAAGLVKDVVDVFFKDGYFNADEIIGDHIAGLNENWDTSFSDRVFKWKEKHKGEDGNKGPCVHFSGGESLPKNPYEGLTWDEYCKAKAREREEEKAKAEVHKKNYPDEDEKPNLGTTTHFGDDDKIRISSDDIKDMIMKEVKMLKEGMETGEEGQVQDMFPKKASGRFTMNTRRGLTDKYRVFVEKTDNEELLTDIFIYDERDKEWYPQAEYVVGIEEYLNGSWLPYWETFNGDVSIWALANCFNKVVKLWKKVGYLYEEDDEIPFRYSGDYMKGAKGGLF